MKYSTLPVNLCALLILFLSSCYTYTYISNVVNVPSPQKKGELLGAAYLSWNHAELQASYAATKDMAVMANGYYGTFGESFVEGGLGHYIHFGQNQYCDFWGGYGYGNINVRNLTADEFTREGRSQSIYLGEWENHAYYSAFANYHRIFAQANYGWKWEFAELDFSLRTDYAYYPHYYFEYKMYHKYGNLVNSDTLSIYNFSSVFAEPAITFKLKFGVLHWIMQTGRRFPFFGYNSHYIQHPVTDYFFSQLEFSYT